MKTIYVPRITIVCLLIMLLCMCGLVLCITNIYAYHHPMQLSYLSGDELESGRYVSGTITSYVISPRKAKGTEYYDYFGNYTNLVDEEYIGFIIPFDKEEYIRVWINNQESLALLNETQDGLHVNAPFVGRIYNWDASQSQLTDDMLGFEHNKVITNYAIVQKDLSTEIYWVKVCLVGVIMSLLLYGFKGKIEVSP